MKTNIIIYKFLHLARLCVASNIYLSGEMMINVTTAYIWQPPNREMVWVLVNGFGQVGKSERLVQAPEGGSLLDS